MWLTRRRCSTKQNKLQGDTSQTAKIHGHTVSGSYPTSSLGKFRVPLREEWVESQPLIGEVGEVPNRLKPCQWLNFTISLILTADQFRYSGVQTKDTGVFLRYFCKPKQLCPLPQQLPLAHTQILTSLDQGHTGRHATPPHSSILKLRNFSSSSNWMGK